MKPKIALVFTALAFFFIFLSCQSLQQLVQSPSVKIAGVKLDNINFQSVTLDFDLQVHNPNGFGMNLSGYTYRFALQDKELLSGNETKGVSVAAQGESHVHIPLTLQFKEIYSLIQNTKSLDSLAYQLSGSITPSGIFSNLTVPFSKSGSLPNIRIPEVSLQGLKVNKLNLTGIDLNLVMRLKNPNTFGFNLGKLNYAIQLAGQSVATGETSQAAAVPSKGTGEIRLPIKLDFLSAASSLKTALGGGSIECNISGGADLDTPFGNLALPIETKQIVSIVK